MKKYILCKILWTEIHIAFIYVYFEKFIFTNYQMKMMNEVRVVNARVCVMNERDYDDKEVR